MVAGGLAAARAVEPVAVEAQAAAPGEAVEQGAELGVVRVAES